MGKKVFIVLAALCVAILIFLGVVAMQPAEVRIVRTTSVAAPAADVFAQVNDLHQWEAWSHWARLDPNSKSTFEGPESGVGSIFKWSGNEQVGEGEMTITESRPSEFVRLDVKFVKPFEGSSLSEFVFQPEGEQTAVTWTTTSKNTFLGKAFCLFINMEEMLGGDMEKGLANMKSVVEAREPDAESEQETKSANE